MLPLLCLKATCGGSSQAELPRCISPTDLFLNLLHSRISILTHIQLLKCPSPLPLRSVPPVGEREGKAPSQKLPFPDSWNSNGLQVQIDATSPSLQTTHFHSTPQGHRHVTAGVGFTISQPRFPLVSLPHPHQLGFPLEA